MNPTPKTDTWIDINTFDVPIAEYRQLGYLHQKGEYKNADTNDHPHFTFTKYVAATAMSIALPARWLPSNTDMVRVCYTFYPVDE